VPSRNARAPRRFRAAPLAYGHGTTNAVDEAAFLMLEALRLPIHTIDPWLYLEPTAPERARLLTLIDARIGLRMPAPYLVGAAYMRGVRFHVDRRALIPRSFIGELLDSHFSGEDGEGGALIDDPAAIESVLDLCTGSGCLAILASRNFPNARIDAVDISSGALEVAARNIADYGLEDRVTLHRGDLFQPLVDRRYDLIISNPPYVDAEGMADLPRECRAEPKIAFDGGADGLNIVRRIIEQAGRHLTPQGGLLCEIGRGRDMVEAAFPQLPLLWLDTEDSDGEVFWIGAADL